MELFSPAICIFRNRYVPLLSDEQSCLKILVGTKLDAVHESDEESNASSRPREVSREEAREYAKQINSDFLSKHPNAAVPYFETSSKTNYNISDTFEYIFEQCLGQLHTDYCKPEVIKLDEKPAQTNTSNITPRKKCC